MKNECKKSFSIRLISIAASPITGCSGARDSITHLVSIPGGKGEGDSDQLPLYGEYQRKIRPVGK